MAPDPVDNSVPCSAPEWRMRLDALNEFVTRFDTENKHAGEQHDTDQANHDIMTQSLDQNLYSHDQDIQRLLRQVDDLKARKKMVLAQQREIRSAKIATTEKYAEEKKLRESAFKDWLSRNGYLAVGLVASCSSTDICCG
jgi:hypothetical protein